VNCSLKLGSQHSGSAKLTNLFWWLAYSKMARTGLAMLGLAVGGQPESFFGRLVCLKFVTWHGKFTQKLENFGSPGVYRRSAATPRANSAFWQKLLTRSFVFGSWRSALAVPDRLALAKWGCRTRPEAKILRENAVSIASPNKKAGRIRENPARFHVFFSHRSRK
jgi:hypothetical protein